MSPVNPDQVARDDRPDPEQLGERRPRRGDGGMDPPVRHLELFVEALHIGQQLDGLVTASGLCRVVGATRSKNAIASDALSSLAIPPGASSMSRL
jgi:hypothetical protein